jgi:tRNA-specific 2-thiouridylase
LDLVTAEKKDSQGLCFIGKVRLPDFLQQKLQPKEGIIIEINAVDAIYSLPKPTFLSLEEKLQFESQPLRYETTMGKIVGKHQGAHYFTIGQRKGLNVGGTKEGLFVLATDIETNTIYTGQGQTHPGLFRNALRIQPEEIHWVREDVKLQNGESREVIARIRYRQPLQKARLHQFESGLYLVFEEPLSAITAGQFAAWYDNDELVGSGVIS